MLQLNPSTIPKRKGEKQCHPAIACNLKLLVNQHKTDKVNPIESKNNMHSK